MKTRVLCAFFDKSEYKEEIESLRQAARILANRISLRVGIITN
jgi:hypothetical protein